MSATFLSTGNNAELVSPILQFQDDVLVVVAVPLVDTLSVHDSQLVVQVVVEQVAINLQTEVTAIVQTIERIVATRIAGDSLRADVNELELYG